MRLSYSCQGTSKHEIAPVLFEDIGRLLNAQAFCLRVEQVHSDGHDHAHARKEEEEAPTHGAQHGQVRLHTQE